MATFSEYAHGQFSWVDLSSQSMGPAKDFYGKLFGWTVEDQNTQGGPPYAIFSLEGREVAGLGELDEVMKSQGIPSMWNSYINVDDIQAVAKKVAEHGGTITVPPMEAVDAGWLCFFMDPTGAHVGLWQKAKHIGAQVCNEPGALCWNELLTRDLEKAKTFYGAVLGWEYQKHDASPTDYSLIQAKSGMNGGIMQMTEELGDAPPHWAVYFAVADADAAAARIAELGGKALAPPFDTAVGKIAIMADPQGAAFSIIALKPAPAED